MDKKRVLSGIRATGKLHIGNYFGAVKSMVELQNKQEYETIYMVVDLHTITTPYEVESLKKSRREILNEYLAAGLDPEKSVIFYQSDVKEHTELAFYLSTVVTIARMLHLPTYKDKVKQYPKENTMALLNYPVLMAADILLYKAELVPAGIDQEPHLEIAREIARKMNSKYGMDFPEPKRFNSASNYIPSLTGDGKMSKSVEGSYINLTDDYETIKRKIARIPTDSGIDIEEAKKGSLYAFYKAIFPDEFEEVFNKNHINGKIRYSDIKENLANSVFKLLKPIQQKISEFSDAEVDKVAREGAEKARAIAVKTIVELKQKMGF